MNPADGFVDLRLNRPDQRNQESFWPSFTDIMTVIVMIFLIAMVVLLLRNMELVRQLRATIEAERSALELARSTGEEKENLALRLFTTENQLSRLQIRALGLEEDNRRQRDRILSQEEQISRLQAEKEVIVLREEQLSADNQSLAQQVADYESSVQSLQQDLSSARRQLQDARDRIADIQQALSGLQTQHETTRGRLVELQERFGEQRRELAEARNLQRRSGQRLNALQSDYDQLQVKYDELLRPARSPEGRYLVEVRYSKPDGRYQIEFATEDAPEFREISREELERRLTALKSAQPSGLYIKIIFPDDSGLTFNEAWTFTSQLHARYDYYQQEAPGPAEGARPQ